MRTVRFPRLWILAALAAAACKTAPPPECNQISKINAWSDADGDGFGDPATQQQVCALKEGLVSIGGDCDDTDADVSPDGIEVCDGLDNDCNTTPDDGLPLVTWYADADLDSFGDVNQPLEACNQPPGYVYNADDCNDSRADVNPIAPEVCDDGVDDDCDLYADDDDLSLDLTSAPNWYEDADGDGYGDPAIFIAHCENPHPGDLVDNADDCDDTTATINPGVVEVCDGIDNDCDTYLDDDDPDLDQSTLKTWWHDGDGDGYGDLTSYVTTCQEPFFYSANDDDCDDDDPLLGPPTLWTPDLDGDGYGIATGVVGPVCDPGPDYAIQSLGLDCDDGDPKRNPGMIEVCNGFDDECDNLVDDADPSLDLTSAPFWYNDADKDGYGAGLGTQSCAGGFKQASKDGDCADGDASINPGVTEVCDDIDNDCDALVDEADPSLDPLSVTDWYPDLDGDGYGDDALVVSACDAPSDIYTATGGDCDDADPDLGPPTDWLDDSDGDGYGSGPPIGPTSCVQPQPGTEPASKGVDCNEGNPGINPGAFDICGNGVDEDCVGGDDACDQPTCADWLAVMPGAPDGIYEIEPVLGQKYDVWCDMTTDGGGWTLVASSGANLPLSDLALPYHADLTTLSPAASHVGVWDGLRPAVTPLHDVRFACKTLAADAAFTVDLSFHGVDWYTEVTGGTETDSCFLDGGTTTWPDRRDNIAGVSKGTADAYNLGVLEGEDACSATDDFTVDFDDRGMDGNESDGTDWGIDDGHRKCGSVDSGEAFFLFVR